MHYIMTFAFINIHLDIYRIIIIIPQKTDASAMRRNFEERGNFHASLCTKRREGVFRLRLKSEVSFTSKADCTRIKEKRYITRYAQIYISFFYNYITKISPEFFAEKSFAATVKLQLVTLQLHHPAHIKA